jgi:poly-gamma-glutamate synthesis protein (capsule biosynthesis protein)
VAKAGIQQAGAGRNGKEARTPAILEANGIRIGFLAYSAVGRYDPRQKDTGRVYDTTKPGIAACVRDFPCLKRKVVEDVTALAREVDIPVVSFHWGVESNYEPEEFQVVLAHAAIDAGARVILGHHPHVLQGVEVYKDSLVFYSLGNFMFGGNWNPKDQDSIIARMTFARQPDDSVTVAGVSLIPVKISNPPDAYFQPFVYDKAHRERVLRKLQRISAQFGQTLPVLERPRL